MTMRELIEDYLEITRGEQFKVTMGGAVNDYVVRDDGVVCYVDKTGLHESVLALHVIKKFIVREWKPRHREYYYFVKNDGTVDTTKYLPTIDEGDKLRIMVGNYFATEEEALRAAKEMKKLFHSLKK